MAKIEFRLSKKVLTDSGRSEIVIQLSHQHLNMRAKSEVFVSPAFFEFYIDLRKTGKMPKELTASVEKAARNGYVLQEFGDIVIRQRVDSPDVIFHKQQKKRLDGLKDSIMSQFEKADKEAMTKDWLKDVVDKYNHPEKYLITPIEEKKRSIYQIINEYCNNSDRQLAESHAKMYRVLNRMIARYCGYIRATDKDRRDFEFDIDTVTREDIEDFSDYLRNEKELADDKPHIFKEIISNYPEGVVKGNNTIEARGENSVIKMRARLRSIFRYCNVRGYTDNRPFEGLMIGTAKVGTPIYITINERNIIAEADLESAWATMPKDEQQAVRMSLNTLMAQRDIFVFQCLIGCRVSDLLNLNEGYIHNGILVYTPRKTKDESSESVQARVPLHQKALSLIDKYRGVDAKGRLFPFISAQRYNDAIKVIFRMSGITRKVEVRNSLTGEIELIPINEVASSHLARRTFVGNAYFKVHDPNLIGKMSGHVEGSKAFARYRKIEDDTLKEVIDLIG